MIWMADLGYWNVPYDVGSTSSLYRHRYQKFSFDMGLMGVPKQLRGQSTCQARLTTRAPSLEAVVEAESQLLKALL